MRFLADAMVGRLSRWLRFLGFDARYEPSGDSHTLIEIARDEDRTILTRNKVFLGMRTDVPVLFLDSEKTLLQIRQVVDQLGLRDRIRPFSRCAECNVELEGIEKEDVRGEVPFYVFSTKTSFSRCPACGRYYWSGEHREKMEKRISEILGGNGEC
jgi:uncharacterized protein with PIN domain